MTSNRQELAPVEAGQEFFSGGEALFVITAADYARLLEAAECDEMIVRCEGCGAWLDRGEPETCTVSDVTGCWAYATGRDKDQEACKRHRVCQSIA